MPSCDELILRDKPFVRHARGPVIELRLADVSFSATNAFQHDRAKIANRCVDGVPIIDHTEFILN
jgi:hypothetical protein